MRQRHSLHAARVSDTHRTLHARSTGRGNRDGHAASQSITGPTLSASRTQALQRSAATHQQACPVRMMQLVQSASVQPQTRQARGSGAVESKS